MATVGGEMVEKDGIVPGQKAGPKIKASKIIAEDARFELARGCPQHAFQACALGH